LGRTSSKKSGEVLLQIRKKQPEVFAELERIRQSLWSGAPYNTWTLLVMTHKAAALWQFSILSRAWHHPDFDPDAGFEQHKHLAQRFTLDRIVFDDPKPDDFIEVMTGELYRFIADQQKEHSDWRSKSRSERLSIHSDLVGPTVVPPFEEFNALMRLNLDSLEPVCVDFQAIPFGNDQVGAKGIYRPTNGTKFYLGPKEWLGMSGSTQLTIITTESLVCEIADKAIRMGRKRIAGRLNLTNLPGIYPIKVPAVCEARAAADGGGKKAKVPAKEKVSALVEEILGSSQNAIVIADGVSDRVKSERVYTFQKAKGVNGLEDKDVYIIVRNLHPDVYAQLNVLGQWLDRPDLIDLHYADQISQAVGRNRGFRDNGAGTKTVVITSVRLWVHRLKKLQSGGSRTLLHLESGKLW
jgi:hypothetical protein